MGQELDIQNFDPLGSMVRMGYEFDYSDFIEREFDRGGTPRVKKMNLIFKAISILLILFLLIWLW